MSDIQSSRRSYLSRKACLWIIIAALPVLLYFEIARPTLSADTETLSPMILMTVTRTVGAVVFLALLLSEGYRVLNPLQKPFGRSLLFSLLPILVAVNNTPFYCLVWGDATVTHSRPLYWVMLVLECLAIGLFEELTFRGVILLSFAERRCNTRKGLLVSLLLTSAVFGVVHLFNLIGGASLPSVLLQIGYSFLIGAMCSVVLLKTRNIWLCVLIHAVYDFGGKLIPTLVSGTLWDTPTVIVTTVLALVTTGYLTWQFFKLDLGEVEKIYSKS